MKKIITVSMFALVATCASAQTSKTPFGYNFIQLTSNSGSVDSNGYSFDTSSFGVGASLLIDDDTFITGVISNGNMKLGNFSADDTTYSFGFGVRVPVNNKTDANLGVSYISTTASGDLIGTMTGYDLSAGLRHALTDKLEINGRVGLSVLGSARIQTTFFSTGLRYQLVDNISLGVGYGSSSNNDAAGQSFSGSLRVDF